MKYYLVCNWKMNPVNSVKARSLLLSYNKEFTPSKKEKTTNKKLIVCPPSIYFLLFDKERSREVKLGAQGVYAGTRSNQTGQISSKMIKGFGAEYCLVGHSEMREMGEKESDIFQQIKDLLKNYITPIVFVGYSDYLREIRSIVNSFPGEELNRMIFVFEPKKYIGSSRSISRNELAKAVREIKKMIYHRFKKGFFSSLVGLGAKKHFIPHPAILFGGNVNVDNYKEYLGIMDLSGFVLGRESMNPENVKKIFKDLNK